jgi:hypothetical protein
MQTIEYKSGSGEQLRLHELETIPEWIMKIKTVYSDADLILHDLKVVCLQSRTKPGHVEHPYGRMRLGSRSEINLHPDMQLVHAALQPNAPAGLQRCWLCEFSHA